MEKAFIIGAAANLAINLCYTVFALLVGVLALKWIDKKILKVIDLEQEIQKGNIAAAIFASAILVFIALIISFGFKG